jgi:hypothetical protein
MDIMETMDASGSKLRANMLTDFEKFAGKVVEESGLQGEGCRALLACLLCHITSTFPHYETLEGGVLPH